MEWERKTRRLAEVLARHKRWLIAYSGGVDSAFLLWFASRQEGIEALGVLADSPSLKRSEWEASRAFAERHGLMLRVVGTEELENGEYRANPANRCFFCKQELFERMRALAESEGFEALAYGENADDPAQERPGRLAAEKFAVAAPLREAGLAKADIRALAAEAGLEVADKPAQPCLASRIPHGMEVSAEKLRQVEAAEAVLAAEGFRVFRVRHHGERALVQVGRAERTRLEDCAVMQRLQVGIHRAGFDVVDFDPQGYPG